MKRIILLFVFLGLLVHVNAQTTTNPEWKTYLNGTRIDDIVDAGDYLWIISNFNKRVIKFDKNSNIVEYFDYQDFNVPSHDNFITIECDKNNLPMVGTYTGAYKMTDENNWLMFRSGNAGIILRGKNGDVWVAYVHGLLRYEDGSDLIEVLDRNNISSLAMASNGDLWSLTLNFVGFLENLSKYDGNNWNDFAPPFMVGSVSNLNIDENGTKWISAYFGPLISYDDTIWKTYDTPVQTRINSIAIENENVWCGTTDGLMRFNNSQWTIYNTENSELPSDTVYHIAVNPDGTKWIGTAKGLAAFNENGLLSTTDHSKLMNGIVLFPNPANDFITLKTPDGLQNLTVDIFDIKGRTMKTFIFKNNRIQLDISQFPTGIYFVNINSDGNHITKKFIKQ